MNNSLLFSILILFIGITIGLLIPIMTFADTAYCDTEAYIYLINNNLEGLIECINLPDTTQDIRIESLEVKTEEIERTLNATRLSDTTKLS